MPSIMNDLETAQRFVVDFLITLLQIYWSLFVKMATIAEKNYTVVFGENHYQGIFTALLILYTTNALVNWYYKPNYHLSELVDNINYMKQKLKYQKQDNNLIFAELEGANKKFKTMEAKIKKLERELKKYD